MEKSLPARLANLKELTQVLSLSVQIQAETAAILDELAMRVYSLEEDRKRLLASSRSHDDSIKSLEKRYSELLYKVSEMRNS